MTRTVAALAKRCVQIVAATSATTHRKSNAPCPPYVG
jgi:hypothetical protein